MNVSNLARPAVPIKDQIWYAVKDGDLEEFKRLTKYGKIFLKKESLVLNFLKKL